MPVFETYDVNEYIDLMNKRSSISVYHRGSDQTTLYFNEILNSVTTVDQESETGTRRIFISYDSNNGQCETRKTSDWTFSSMQAIIEGFFEDEDTDHQDKMNRDTVIGPCGLYLAAMEKPDKFLYSRTYSSELRLTYLSVFESVVDDKQTNTDDDEGCDDNHRYRLKIRVHTIDRADAKDKAQYKNLDDFLSAAHHNEIAIITVSRTQMKSGVSTASTTIAPTNEDDEELLLHVEFRILTELVPSSLVGQPFNRNGIYDFFANPFLRPIGIGCYNGDAVDHDSNSAEIFQIPSLQVSAEYFTTDGSKGVSYVAFDGHNHVLRLDRNGRKSIYDLKDRKSYHTSEYSAQGEPGESLILEGVPGCCVLPIEDRSFESSNAIERLIGLASNDQAHRLGSLVLDSVSYEVYESELIYKGNKALQRGYVMPILLEATGFSMPLEETNNRYFITYYMHINNARFSKRAKNPVSSSNNVITKRHKALFPQIIELWEHKTSTRARRLINRVQFPQFSWALDVQPSNDPESTDMSAIFNVEQCLKSLSSQSELSFFIRQWSESKLRSEEEISALQSNVPLIKEVIQENLVQLFDISRLNIVRQEVSIRKSSDILVKAKISELVDCVTYSKSIGSLPIEHQLVAENLLRVQHNRHSLEECKLDSISERAKNWLAYCPNLSVCLTLKPSDKLIEAMDNHAKESINRQADDKPIEDNTGDFCDIMIFTFSQHSTRKDEVYFRVRENLHKLNSGKFIFEFPHKDSSTNEWYWPKYSGFGHSYELHRINSAGELLGSAKAVQLLKGLRYTTSDERPETINMNSEFELSLPENTRKDSVDVFTRCQIACQMDSFCASFSCCVRKKHEGSPYDCVLSSTRLTRERINNIVSANSLADESSNSFMITVTSETDSQTMMIARDDACNLHPKDYLFDYKLTKRFEPVQFSLPEEGATEKFNRDAAKRSMMASSSTAGRRLSLNDCAGLCFERNLWSNPIDSNFTYCPLSSECFLWGDKGLNEAVSFESEKHCYLYRRVHTLYFDKKLMARLSIETETSKPDLQSNAEEQESKAIPEHREAIDGISDKLEKLNIVRWFEGLSAEECARDCNLRKTNCLAFDYCRSAKLTLCILYSVRSPAKRSSASYPLTHIEKELLSVGGTKNLVSHQFCTHFFLKEDYLEIRLQQIDANTAVAGNGSSVVLKQIDRKKRLESVESKVLDVDQQRSEEGRLRNQKTLDSKSIGTDNVGTTSAIRFNWLLVGLLIGGVSTMYKREAATVSLRLYDTISNKLTRMSSRESVGHFANEPDNDSFAIDQL